MSVPIEESQYASQLGAKVLALQERCASAESQVDGFNAKIDQLTTDKVLLEREIEKLKNQLEEAKRQSKLNGS